MTERISIYALSVLTLAVGVQGLLRGTVMETLTGAALMLASYYLFQLARIEAALARRQEK